MAAIGALNRSVLDFNLREGTKLEDATNIVRGVTGRALLTHWIAEFNNVVTADAFRSKAEYWQKHGLSKGDERVAQELRLTHREMAEIRSGKMSTDTFNKIVQNGVKITQYVTEDAHRRAAFQNVPILNAIFSYNNYAIGTAKSTARMVGDVTSALKSKDPVKMAAAGKRLAYLLAGSVGAGVASLMLGRAVRNETVKHDDESYPDLLGKSLWSVQMFGPAQRIVDVTGYDNDLEKQVVNFSPKLKLVTDTIHALMGNGPYKATPRNEVLGKFAKSNVPVAKAVDRWVNPPKERSSAERLASKLLAAKLPDNGSPEQTEHNRFKREIVEGLRSTDAAVKKEADAKLRQGFRDGRIKRDEISDIMARARDGDLLHVVKKLSPAEAVQVYEAMNGDEKKQHLPAIRLKIASSQINRAEKDALLARLK